MSRIFFTAVPRGHYDVLRLALDAAQLPTDDLMDEDLAFFMLADEVGAIGFVGLQGVGTDRLLRSLVVLPSRTGEGNGGLLMAHIETLAGQGEVERLHLLTVSAAAFFRARGYRETDRADAPAEILATAQFRALCPSSATYLVKALT